MKRTRYTLLALFLFLTVTCVCGYFFSHSYQYGICFSDASINTYDVSCHSFYDRIGDALYYSTGALAIVFLLLSIWPIALRAWGMFALWSIPLAADPFLFYQWNDGPLGGIPPSPSPEQVFKWLAIMYVVGSVVVICTSVWRHRKGKPCVTSSWSPRKKLIFWGVWGIYVALIFVPRIYAIIWRLTA